MEGRKKTEAPNGPLRGVGQPLSRWRMPGVATACPEKHIGYFAMTPPAEPLFRRPRQHAEHWTKLRLSPGLASACRASCGDPDAPGSDLMSLQN
jgi:hypothetical protein